jgi:hypothetical protein
MSAPRVNAWTVVCPKCGAPRAQVCRSTIDPARRVGGSQLHAERQEAARLYAWLRAHADIFREDTR